MQGLGDAGSRQGDRLRYPLRMRSRWWLGLVLSSVGCGISPRHGAEMGEPCSADDECKSALCLLETEPLFGTGGPPGGLCSESCDDEDNCPSQTVCTPTLAGKRCLLGCDFGDDPKKCGNRQAYACEPLLFPYDVSCQSDDDCQSGESCLSNSTGGKSCALTLGVCTPRCGSDQDCADGRFCNGGTGECVDDAPQGLDDGEACEIGKAQCRGSCIEYGDGTAACAEYCRIGAQRGCGATDLASSSRACDTFAYGDVGVDQGKGDTGVCTAR